MAWKSLVIRALVVAEFVGPTALVHGQSPAIATTQSGATQQVACGCDGDANHDGAVNFHDITSVLENWLSDCPPNPPCDDGDPCTTDDVCKNGTCAGVPIDCDDANPCTFELCDNGICTHSPVPEGWPCGDDGDPCTSDVCSNTICVHAPSPDGSPCDDGDPTTVNEVCMNGICMGQFNPCGNQAPGLTPVWRPIDNGGCVDQEFEYNLTAFATADLYVRMATTNSMSTTAPFSLQFVSAEVSGVPAMTLANGAFFQHDAGGNTRPAASQVQNLPCLAFDSYYAIDTVVTEAPPAGDPAFQPSPLLILPPGVGAFTPTGIRGLWVVAGFGASNAIPAARDAVRFPNDPCGYYVRIGRFTITRGATFGGTLLVAFVLPGTGTTATTEVSVPNCTECWEQPAPPPPPP